MFGVLAIAERLFSRPDWTIAHVQPNADGLTAPGRPVYTMQLLVQNHENTKRSGSFAWCLGQNSLEVSYEVTGTWSGGSMFQSSSSCRAIAVWAGLYKKYHVLWLSRTSMSSCAGPQLLQHMVCRNGCVFFARWLCSTKVWVEKWSHCNYSRIFWCKFNVLAIFGHLGLSLLHLHCSAGHLPICWLGWRSLNVRHHKICQVAISALGSPTDWSLNYCFTV